MQIIIAGLDNQYRITPFIYGIMSLLVDAHVAGERVIETHVASEHVIETHVVGAYTAGERVVGTE